MTARSARAPDAPHPPTPQRPGPFTVKCQPATSTRHRVVAPKIGVGFVEGEKNGSEKADG